MTAGSRNGFTLIEVLVALAVFGVLSVMGYMALGQTLSNADLLQERMQRLEAIQRTVRFLDSDLMQTSPRPVRDLLGDGYEPAIRSRWPAACFTWVMPSAIWGNMRLPGNIMSGQPNSFQAWQTHWVLRPWRTT